jgi:hypothetical protein
MAPKALYAAIAFTGWMNSKPGLRNLPEANFVARKQLAPRRFLPERRIPVETPYNEGVRTETCNRMRCGLFAAWLKLAQLV